MFYTETKLLITGVLLTGATLLTLGALSVQPNTVREGDFMGSTAVQTNSNGILSQCGDTYLFTPDKDDYGTLPDDFEGRIPVHRMQIPIYGYMSTQPFQLRKTGYEPPVNLTTDLDPNALYQYEEITRALYEGNHIIWTSQDFGVEGYDTISDYADKWNNTHSDKVVVMVWPFKDIEIPQGRKVAFSSWGASQSCVTFSEETFQDFADLTNEHLADRDKINPPAAELVGGELQPIGP
jgi:hypothetical protein